jgi:hypothetical protein
MVLHFVMSHFSHFDCYGLCLQVQDGVGRQRPFIVVACHDWDLPEYLEVAVEKGEAILVR